MKKNKDLSDVVYDTLKKFNQLDYIKDFDRKTYKAYHLRLNKSTDAKLIEHLEKQKSKNAYLKNLIKKDIEN